MKPKMSLISSNIHCDIPSKFANNTSQIISFGQKKILHKFYIIFFKQTKPSIQSKYNTRLDKSCLTQHSHSF